MKDLTTEQYRRIYEEPQERGAYAVPEAEGTTNDRARSVTRR
jgi:hypothetical protein